MDALGREAGEPGQGQSQADESERTRANGDGRFQRRHGLEAKWSGQRCDCLVPLPQEVSPFHLVEIGQQVRADDYRTEGEAKALS